MHHRGQTGRASFDTLCRVDQHGLRPTRQQLTESGATVHNRTEQEGTPGFAVALDGHASARLHQA
jgi:hypothetical protein